jgi:sulfur relay (sulfurtransferase) DsrC/TusE family protein
MVFEVNRAKLETDSNGYLPAPDYNDEVVHVIAQAEGIELNDDHSEVVQYLVNHAR